jgi:glycosyltransferase involved in cell wall biosynthesis
MMTTPIAEGKVSIVIPCYNHGPMLRESLASVERVRNSNLLEVIVVDDGSSEVETRKILDELEHEGHCVLRQPNRGASAARNAGIRLANGEFILPLDSDNRLRAVYLNEGVSLLKDNANIGVVYTDAEYFGESSGRWHVQEFNLLSLIRWNFLDVCALYRRSLWCEVGGYDEQMPSMGLEDWDFWLRLSTRGVTFVHLPTVGFDYRVRKGSLRTEGYMHAAEIIDYIFDKPELACYKLLRETDEEAQQLRGGIRTMQASLSYRLGRTLLAPARLLRKLWRRFSLRRCK